jgi:hypothetical protein
MMTQGSLVIDWVDWKRHTVYGVDWDEIDEETSNADVVVWFWEYVKELAQEGLQEDLQKILMFSTGSPRTSASGFEFLKVCLT